MGRVYLGGDLRDLREILMTFLRREKRGEPETRVGICCGDACKAKQQAAGTWTYALLFKVQGLYRYRCDECFAAECGKRHYLAAQMVPV